MLLLLLLPLLLASLFPSSLFFRGGYICRYIPTATATTRTIAASKLEQSRDGIYIIIFIDKPHRKRAAAASKPASKQQQGNGKPEYQHEQYHFAIGINIAPTILISAAVA